MQPTGICIAGSVEQGVILFAKMMTKAITIIEGKHASMAQKVDLDNGGCSVQLIVADQQVFYRHVSNPDLLVVMSQQAYTRFSPQVKRDGLMLIEEDLVHLTGLLEHTRVYRIPALRLAAELGDRTLLNIVMLAAFGAITVVVKGASLREAVGTSILPAFRDLTLEAYDKGYAYGRQQLLSVPFGSGL